MSSMSPSGLHVNKPAIAILFGLIVVGIVYFKMSGNTPVTTNVDLSKQSEQKADNKAQASTDLKDIKVTLINDLKVKVGDKELTVTYRETKCSEAKLDVLFLHGMKFTSETWATDPMWTLQLLYQTGGFRAVAVDLPGYGKSPPADGVDPIAFMEALIEKLQLKAPVIISPSMSGGYSLPYLFKSDSDVLSRCSGFVPVAPVGTGNYNQEQYSKLTIPTLVIYGENDTTLGAKSTQDFQGIPNKTIVQLAGAGHACYMNKPDEFHKHLIDFLKKVSK